MAPRIAVYGVFGVGNVGNDESGRVMIDLLRSKFVDAELWAISGGADAAGDLGVPTLTLTRTTTGRRNLVTRVMSKLLAFPQLVRTVGGFDAVIVSGTGLLENRRPMPGGDLIWLWLLCVAGRIRRVPVSWFAIGGGRELPLPARAFARSALRLTHYRSFRDAVTPASLRSGIADRSVVIPDLVFARRAAEPRVAAAAAAPRRLSDATVGVAIIDYDDTEPIEKARYYQAMTAVVAALHDRGSHVVFLLGDSADAAPTERVREAASDGAERNGSDAVSPFGDFGALLAAAAGCDVVVASRFHVLIAAVLAARPLIAVSHATKDDILLDQLNLQRFCIPAASVTVLGVMAAVEAALAEARSLTSELTSRPSAFADDVRNELSAAELVGRQFSERRGL